MNLKLGLLGLSVFLACAAPQAHAVGHLADVTVVDRDSGATLPVYFHRGEYWVAGRPGARYAIALRSKLGERLMAVTSVDGVNVLSGETASWSQTGYVFRPTSSTRSLAGAKATARSPPLNSPPHLTLTPSAPGDRPRWA